MKIVINNHLIESDSEASIGSEFKLNNIRVQETVSFGYKCDIAPDVKIENGCKIGDYVKIGKGSILRNNCVLGNFASIGKGVTIETGCNIFDRAIIGNHSTIQYEATILKSTAIGLGTTIFRGTTPTEQVVLYNGYDYVASGYTDQKTGLKYIQLGCYIRTIDEWDNEFWNNPSEFPNRPENEGSQRRLRTYERIKKALS